MFRAVLLCSALMAVDPPAPAPPSAEDLATYRAAREQVGRDADAHVRLALWCEAHGLKAERLKHLALAVAIDPAQAAARGLMGLVADGGQWRRPEAVAEAIRADAGLAAKRAAYNGRRARAQDTAAAQWELAVWCERQGLKAEATAHFTAVTRLDPRREAAWKRLGYTKHAGRWMTAEQIAAERSEAEKQQEADRRWRPLLETWKARLDKPDRRSGAEEALAGVTDPRAVPSIGQVFGRGGEADQQRAVQLLGQIDDPAASRALAGLSVFSPSAEVRRAATETLKWRDPREFAHLLIGLLRDPIKYEVRPVGGPGSPGTLLVEGQQFNLRRSYSPPAPPPVLPGDALGYDASGLPVARRFLGFYSGSATGSDLVPPAAFLAAQTAPRTVPTAGQASDFLARTPLGEAGRRFGPLAATYLQAQDQFTRNQAWNSLSPLQQAALASGAGPNSRIEYTVPVQAEIPVGRMAIEAERAAQVAQEQLQSDVAAIDAHNLPILQLNARAVGVLNDVTGQALAEDREAWRAWWVDQIGYTSRTNPAPYKPTLEQEVPLAYRPRVPIAVFDGPPVSLQRFSCFGAGTPVRTLDGIRPIEAIRAGDRVLTQDTATGALSFQPVLVVHHNPPSATLRVQVGDETIVSSTFHRFWRVGRGWAMARDLRPGDAIRTLGGSARVGAVESGEVQPVFNLDVAGNRTFFVGQAGSLVHDNSVPGLRTAPFDAAPQLAAADPRAD